MLNPDEIYIAHIDSQIMCMGTKDECEAYRDSRPYRCDCWKISTVTEYGEHCYEFGCETTLG